MVLTNPFDSSKMIFVAKDVPFSFSGGIKGIVRLELINDISVKVCNDIDIELLHGSYVEADCKGFRSLHIKGRFGLNEEKYIPVDFPPHDTVYYYYSRWKREGLIDEINECLVEQARGKAGRDKSPSAACIDSQSVKTTRLGGEQRGVDGGKKVKGRKRHIITDTMGLLLAVVVHAAKLTNPFFPLIRVVMRTENRFNAYRFLAFQNPVMNHVGELFNWHAANVIVTNSKREIVFLQEIKMSVNCIEKAFAQTVFAGIVIINSILNIVKRFRFNVKCELFGHFIILFCA